MEYLHQLFNQVIGLLTILNPVAAAAIMVSLLGRNPEKREIRVIAKKAALTVFIACIVTIGMGEILFNFFGINTYSIEVIGGIVVLRMAMKMIEGNTNMNQSSDESEEAIAKPDVSVIPLGIPVLFGPGVIATLILFRSGATSVPNLVVLILSTVIASLGVLIILMNAQFLSSRLGVTGLKIATRILGLIVGAMAVQFIVKGLFSLWVHLHKN